MVYRTVSKFLTRFLSDSGAREIWVACSGGLDSMTLLALVQEFVLENQFTIGVVHCNHNLRRESAEDECFVVETALKSGLPVVVGQARDLKSEALTTNNSLETAARNYRYALFMRFLKTRPQALLMTAHNATDQVETIMMNLMRGTGLRGVKGIPQRRGRIGRPLLEVTRAQLADYADRNHIAYRDDPSNDSLEFSRNRVRHELLPVVRRLGGPGVEERIAGAGLRLAADLRIIDRKVDALWSAVDDVAGGLAVSRKSLQKLEIECRPHFLARMIRSAGAVKQVPARVLAELAGLVGAPGERRLAHYDLGSGLIFKSLPEVVFIGQESSVGASADFPGYRVELVDYNSYDLPGESGTLTLSLLNLDSGNNVAAVMRNKSRFTEIIDVGKLVFPLILRNRRPGDFFQPLGLAGGSCKLKKFFNHRVADVNQRSRIPLLCNGTGEIIWVVGERLDHRFRVRDDSSRLAELNYIPGHASL
jgi:tRNA(Ile)-lysidine synthase